MVWRWVNATLFSLTGQYLNQPFRPVQGSGEQQGGGLGPAAQRQ